MVDNLITACFDPMGAALMRQHLHQLLRQLLPFADYNDEQLERFWNIGREVHGSKGDVLFVEGNDPQGLYLLLEGELMVTKRVEGRHLVLATRQPVALVGEISLLTGIPHTATVQVTKESYLLHFEPAYLSDVQNMSPLLRLMITTMVDRLRSTESLIQQHEKLSALGKLSAGLAHELNNPASASLRAGKELHDTLDTWRAHTLTFAQLALNPEQIALVKSLSQILEARRDHLKSLDPISRSTQEEALDTWMHDHDIADSWRLAPAFVEAGATISELDDLERTIGPDRLGDVLRWIEGDLSMHELLKTITQSTERISDLVAAVKSYSFMGETPIQRVDIHAGLENTLTILGHKLKDIVVTRNYDRDLPAITVHGSKLNQVWTNLIDNAIDAMNTRGKLTITTRREGDQIMVIIADNGPGIPTDILSHVFEPFFTTKDVGEGTGLGLDIVRNIIVNEHQGDVQVTSRPGNTQFRISLPIDQET
jgi:signal transduction histidine kinase